MDATGGRREQLAAAATDYALEHGLIGLSLRPLAAALGTSDRMLIYHFGSKDRLVSEVMGIANARAVDAIRAIEIRPGVHQAVLDLWQACRTPPLDRCQRMYVEAASLGLFGREPYISVLKQENARWIEALGEQLVAAGLPRAAAGRSAVLLDAAFMGFELDLPLGPPDRHQQALRDLADALAARPWGE